MNTISKDQSIITQVAAKIAADLTPKSDDVQINIANWLLAFDATSDALLEKHGMTQLDDQHWRHYARCRQTAVFGLRSPNG